jgi:hypothetical protein
MQKKSPSPRRILIRALALGLLPAPALAQGLFGDRPKRLPRGRSIYRLSGKVTVNGQDATLETLIKTGDTVVTAKGAEIVFVVGQHSMILRGSSMLTLGPAVPAKESLVVRSLRLVNGALLSVSSGTVMSLATPTANVGVRGTGFYVESEPERTYFCTCYGVTDIAAIDDAESRTTIEATHHDRPVYILRSGEAGRKIRNAPFINHTDEELTLIEALVGREPPFLFPKDSYGGPRREY